MSDDGSTVVGDDMSEEGTIVETDTMTIEKPEGVPLQLVLLIAMVSFCSCPTEYSSSVLILLLCVGCIHYHIPVLLIP